MGVGRVDGGAGCLDSQVMVVEEMRGKEKKRSWTVEDICC